MCIGDRLYTVGGTSRLPGYPGADKLSGYDKVAQRYCHWAKKNLRNFSRTLPYTIGTGFYLSLIHIYEKIVAITFDTEWSSSGIERLLPVLADYQIKSTFLSQEIGPESTPYSCAV